MVLTVGIMGNGPTNFLPSLDSYKQEIDVWIGADQGVLTLIKRGMQVSHAVGDFDSIESGQTDLIEQEAETFDLHPAEKDETDMEIALKKALSLNPDTIYMFGVTGGRLDHALINMQLLYTIVMKQIRGVIIDKWNQLEMTTPGEYNVKKSDHYPYVSFVPYTKYIKNLTLNGFYYSLTNEDISWGSTRCISNEIFASEGTFSYVEGLLLLIKSRDASSDTFAV